MLARVVLTVIAAVGNAWLVDGMALLEPCRLFCTMLDAISTSLCLLITLDVAFVSDLLCERKDAGKVGWTGHLDASSKGLFCFC